MIEILGIIGVALIIAIGLIGSSIVIALLLEKAWSKWAGVTKRTAWFFDYLQNRRKYELWLNEQESKEE